MKIYPPYTKWTTVIKDPSEFMLFLQQNVDTCNTGRDIKYRGDVSKNGFVIERNLNHFNGNRPQIRGTIEKNSSEESLLTLNIESRKTLFYVAIGFSIVIGLTGLLQLNIFVLVMILFMISWLGLGGWVLHQIELKKTKEEVQRILEIASGKK